jgi:hypothetical protein
MLAMNTAKLLDSHDPASVTVTPMGIEPDNDAAAQLGIPTADFINALGGLPIIDLSYAELREKLDSVLCQDMIPKCPRD